MLSYESPPGDDGYGFDDYGVGKRLSLEYLGSQLKQEGLQPFFPYLPSSQETGAKRGCVVVTRNGELADRIASIHSLRVYHAA